MAPVFLPFSERAQREPASCVQDVPKHVSPAEDQVTRQGPLVVAFNVKGDGLDGIALTGWMLERLGASRLVTYTCRRAVRWPRG